MFCDLVSQELGDLKSYKPRSHHVGFPDDNRVLEIQKNKIALKDPDIPEEMKAYMTRLSETL